MAVEKKFTFDNNSNMHAALHDAEVALTSQSSEYKASQHFDKILESDVRTITNIAGQTVANLIAKNEGSRGILTFRSTTSTAPLMSNIVARKAYDHGGKDAARGLNE